MTKIKFTVEIDRHPITNLRQSLEMVQVVCIDTDLEFAKAIFRVSSLDENGSIIDDPATNYEFWKQFSNDSKLDQTGRMVTKERTKKENPINEDESEEDYQIRTNELYNQAYESAIGEFNFWMAPFVQVFQTQLDRGWRLLPFP